MIAYYMELTGSCTLLGEAATIDEARELYAGKYPRSSALCLGRELPARDVWDPCKPMDRKRVKEMHARLMAYITDDTNRTARQQQEASDKWAS